MWVLEAAEAIEGHSPKLLQEQRPRAIQTCFNLSLFFKEINAICKQLFIIIFCSRWGGG